jgi:hypothetical protein
MGGDAPAQLGVIAGRSGGDHRHAAPDRTSPVVGQATLAGAHTAQDKFFHALVPEGPTQVPDTRRPRSGNASTAA